MDKGAQMRGIRTMYPKDESLMTWHLFKGGAAGIIQRFAKEVRAKGGTILTETPAKKLIVENGKVVGVEAVDDCVSLESPTSLLTDFESLRKSLQRNAGKNDGVERKQSALVNQLIIFLLVDDVVHYAAGTCHGIVDINENSTTGFVEEAFAVLINPEPGLSQSAAALLEFISAHDKCRRRNVQHHRPAEI